jgi:hypothetical protein
MLQYTSDRLYLQWEYAFGEDMRVKRRVSEMRDLGMSLLAFHIELFRGRAWVVVSETGFASLERASRPYHSQPNV